MSQYDNTNRGVLFRNHKKEQPNQPDHTGNINIDGQEYWLSAWVKESSNGNKFFSLSVKPKDSKPNDSAEPADSGDIPF